MTEGAARATGEGRFTRERMTRAWHAIADRLGVPAIGWQLMRLTNNAVFALPEPGLVIRITRSHGLHERVRKVVRLGGAHRALAGAYGLDVTTDPDWPLLREARELKMVAAAVPLLASTPGVAEEFRTRLASARNRDDRVRWTPFADVSRRQG